MVYVMEIPLGSEFDGRGQTVFYKSSLFHRCSYDTETSDLDLKPNHTYRVQTTWGLMSKRICVCKKHMPFGQQNLTSLGAYPSSMTEEICQSVGEHLKSRASVKF